MRRNFQIVDKLQCIKAPIIEDLACFDKIFDETLHHPNELLDTVLRHIKQRIGKLMRPTLLLLVAKEYGQPNDVTYLSAVMVELLHTASLVHDDVVDESNERRGQPSVNAGYGNKIAVLVGDYLLSSSLEKVAQTQNLRIIKHISILGKQLSAGELMQLSNSYQQEFSEEDYYAIIRQKTAALFAESAEIGAISVAAEEEDIEKMRLFGDAIGMSFQIRDDIFDYFSDANIGKPTGNDMLEGKLTLPVLHVLRQTTDTEIINMAHRIRKGEASKEEINHLITYAKQNGGIEYAEKRMNEYVGKALELITSFRNSAIRNSLEEYVHYVSYRKH